MAKFTQEPWRLLPPAFPHDSYTIQTTVHETGPGCWTCETIASVDTEANGRLIVAAPDMYTLLSAGVEFLKDCGDCSDKGYKLRCAFEYLLALIDGEESNE